MDMEVCMGVVIFIFIFDNCRMGVVELVLGHQC